MIKINQPEEWDSIVKSFTDYDVYYLSGYTKAFQLHGDGEPLLFYYNTDDFRAINVVMKRDIARDSHFNGKLESGTHFDLSTPYGYGGFLIEGTVTDSNITKLDEAYSSYCSGNHIVSEFVRFHPVNRNADVNKKIYDVTDLGNTVTVDLSSKEQIWDNLSSKNRNVIRKAMKSGVTVHCGNSPDLLDDFIRLYEQTMRKDNATPYYYFSREFYISVLEDLKGNMTFFYAVFEEKIISMSMILFGNRKMHYHLSASDQNYQYMAAGNLMLHEAACWGCENGLQSFHLGGGVGSGEDGLYKFKKAFNRNSDTVFSIGKKIFDKEKYDR
ncbi:MAG: GNAT family N-acetyltransferase, partial [Oscillospiraceae bacterium]|nr:GNAT family N-acetyltransferase [Oscillospiraceae bacterium]